MDKFLCIAYEAEIASCCDTERLDTIHAELYRKFMYEHLNTKQLNLVLKLMMQIIHKPE